MGLMYQGVCCSNISSGIIKDIKVNPRTKWRKTVSLSLDNLGLMYQGVCCSNISSGIIKDMKVDPRNKWKKIPFH